MKENKIDKVKNTFMIEYYDGSGIPRKEHDGHEKLVGLKLWTREVLEYNI